MKIHEEQERAIFHQGGVLLNAGAGSGKTFVLVEHFVHLMEVFFREDPPLSRETFKDRLKKRLSEIVIMTFTRKSAGELSLRLKDKITQLELDFPQSRWGEVREGFDNITISTIHGFCYKIIKKGLLIDFDPDFEVVSESKSKLKIEKLFYRWVQSNMGKFRQSPDLALENILLQPQKILSSLVSIFHDPILRKMWKEFDLGKFSQGNLEEFFRDYLDQTKIQDIMDIRLDLEKYAKNQKLQWYQLLQDFENLKGEKLDTMESFNRFVDIFQKYKRMPNRPAVEWEGMDFIGYWEKLKSLRHFFLENRESFAGYFDNCRTHFLLWPKTIKDIVQYIDARYLDTSDITYSDLEYYVHEGLQNPAVAARVRDLYRYFIIDEFQDTSSVQFSLIKKFIGGDFGRLLCVGDVKQAIYGFRGGELKVFEECQASVGQVMELKNNYRSAPEIISFNNMFFGFLFSTGPDFQDRDERPVHFSPQEVPPRDDLPLIGELVKVLPSAEETGRLLTAQVPINSDAINSLEAAWILERILDLRQKFPGETIAILYKNLAPSRFLLALLLQNNLSFTAQIKIPHREDPIIGIFQVLVEKLLDAKGGDGHLKLMLDGYLRFLNVTAGPHVETVLGQFYLDLPLWGLLGSFRKFLFALNVANSNFANNMAQIEDLCLLAQEDVQRIWPLLKKFGNEKYSMDFEHGPRSQEIILMTVHSSKGLEFPHVILGGIHTNGHERADYELLGKLPGSFQWRPLGLGPTGKNLKSPYYLLESLMLKSKNFSESKRLFYVAATRGKVSLSWVDLGPGKELFKAPRNSWIRGFLAFEEYYKESGQELPVRLHFLPDRKKDLSDSSSFQLPKETPLFHRDSLGIAEKIPATGTPSPALLGMVSELSVERLSVLGDCHRKFYLQNICRLEVKEIALVKKIYGVEEGEEEGEREKEEEEPALWKFPQVEALRAQYQLFPRYNMKFPLFGYMLTGTCDLICKPKPSALALASASNSGFEFTLCQSKTKKVAETVDWIKLHLFAYGCYSLNMLEAKARIKMRLIDPKDGTSTEKVEEWPAIKKFLFSHWQKLAFLDQVNSENCSSCVYTEICGDPKPNLAQV